MKKLILLLLLFIGYSEVFSQYTPMLQENAEWYHYYLTFEGFSQTFTIEGDSTVNDVVYKKLTSTVDADSFALNLLREDTLSKQVFRLRYDGLEGLLYDFSLLPGDSVVVNPQEANYNYTLYLDSISNTLPFWGVETSENARIFFFHDSEIYYQTIWIEGIGSLSTPTLSYLPWGWDGFLICHFNDDGIKDYANDFFNNDECIGPYQDNVQELSNSNNLILFPVPASNTLNLKHLQNKRIIKVKILDLSGKLILNENRVNSFQTEVNVSNLASGSYFIDVEFENEERVVKGFVKE